jgi:hypothetical protein
MIFHSPLCLRASVAVLASLFLLTGCITSGTNSKLQAQYDRGQSDAVKELYWAKERAKQPDPSSSAEPQEYLEFPVEQDPNAPIKQVPHTRVLPVLSTHPN